MPDFASRIAAVHERMAAAASRSGRKVDEISLLAVSKTFDAETVVAAARAGLKRLGENRVQEAAGKIPAVNAALPFALEWHLVGGLQRNKAKTAAALFDVVHSVDRPALASALQRGADTADRHIRVLLQVDVDDEPQKGGADPADLPELARATDACAALELVGLMAIPRAHEDPERMRPAFARLRALLDDLNRQRPVPLRELSMGMSADFEVAIEEGSTLIRVGTALFGERTRR